MEAKPGIDRRKHEVDVLEQVLKGVRTEPPEHGSEHVVALSESPWLGGAVASAVQVQIIDDDDSDEQ